MLPILVRHLALRALFDEAGFVGGGNAGCARARRVKFSRLEAHPVPGVPYVAFLGICAQEIQCDPCQTLRCICTVAVDTTAH